MGGTISKKSGSNAAELAARRAAEQRRQEQLRRQAAERRQAEQQRAAAERARSAATQNNARKGLTTGRSNRAGDGFDSVIPGRTSRPVLSNAPAPASTPKTLTNKPAQTPSDREFAALSAREGTRDTLAELGINDGRDLARYAEDLVRDSARAGTETRSVDNQVAHAEIIRAAARTLPAGSEGAELLTDDTFVNALASGAEPFEAATAVEAKALYDETLKPTVQKPLSQWSEHDAERFTDALADAVEDHADNPTLVNQLLALSQGRLERTAEIIGTATEANDYDGDTIEQLAANLSRVGNAAPDDGAATLAHALAAEIDDDSELNKVDDGFKHFIEDGGSDRFRAILNEALEQQGKGEAAEELREDGGGSSIGDRWGDAVSAVTDVVANQTHWALSGANAVYQAGGDALRGQLGRTLDVVDRGLAAVQDHGPSWAQGAAGVGRRGVDGARAGLEFHNRAQEALGGAVVAGGTGAVRAVGGAVADPVGTAKDGVELARQLHEAAKISEQIDSLGAGDSVKLSATVGGSVLGISGELTGDITVKRNDDGSFTVRADGTVGIGAESTGGAGASYTAEGQAQGGVAFEFNLDSTDDATTAVRTLMGVGAGGAAGLLEGTHDGFRPDPALLKENLVAVEVHGGGALELAASAGVEVGPELSAQLRASNTGRARLVLEPEPTFELSAEVNVAGTASASATGAGSPISAGADVTAEASVRVKQSFPIEGLELDALDFVTNPLGVASQLKDHVLETGTTEVTVKAGASGTVGVNGKKGGGGVDTTVTLTAPTGTLNDTISELIDGDFSAAQRTLAENDEVRVKVETNGRVRTQVGAEVEAGDGVDSIELGFTATRTDVSDYEVYEGTWGEASTYVLGAFDDFREAIRG